MLVPKSCLAAGSGKNGGFSKKTPDICCLVYGLGAGTRFAKTSSGQPATKRGLISGVRIELVSASFPAAAPWDFAETKRQRKEKQGQFIDIPGSAPKASTCGISLVLPPRSSALG